MISTSGVLGYPYKRVEIAKEFISLITGAAIAGVLLFSYYKLSDLKDGIMLKQEIVAKKYLEDELGIHDTYIYSDKLDIKLRGEEITVRAYHSTGTRIIMTYKDNRIIRHEIKND